VVEVGGDFYPLPAELVELIDYDSVFLGCPLPMSVVWVMLGHPPTFQLAPIFRAIELLLNHFPLIGILDVKASKLPILLYRPFNACLLTVLIEQVKVKFSRFYILRLM
jgi:hypothetical protein